MKRRSFLTLAALVLALRTVTAAAEDVRIPVLVPLTGFLALEGTSQKNGAILALKHPPAGVTPHWEIADTQTSPELAVNALEKALDQPAIAVVASMLGSQMLAMLPVGAEHKVPLITISGTAKVTELGNRWVFRQLRSSATLFAD